VTNAVEAKRLWEEGRPRAALEWYKRWQSSTSKSSISQSEYRDVLSQMLSTEAEVKRLPPGPGTLHVTEISCSGLYTFGATPPNPAITFELAPGGSTKSTKAIQNTRSPNYESTQLQLHVPNDDCKLEKWQITATVRDHGMRDTVIGKLTLPLNSDGLDALWTTGASPNYYLNNPQGKLTKKHGIIKFQLRYTPEGMEAAEAQLPVGWESRTASDSGDTYYVNTATGKTQWDRPTDPVGETSRPPKPTDRCVIILEDDTR
jgi:hypothetical protein